MSQHKDETPKPDGLVPAITSEDAVNDEGPKIVQIETEDFTAEALSLHELPGTQVAYAMASTGPYRNVALLELFKLAILEPQKSEYIDVLSFEQMAEAIAEWMELSINGAETPEEDDAVREQHS